MWGKTPSGINDSENNVLTNFADWYCQPRADGGESPRIPTRALKTGLALATTVTRTSFVRHKG